MHFSPQNTASKWHTCYKTNCVVTNSLQHRQITMTCLKTTVVAIIPLRCLVSNTSLKYCCATLRLCLTELVFYLFKRASVASKWISSQNCTPNTTISNCQRTPYTHMRKIEITRPPASTNKTIKHFLVTKPQHTVTVKNRNGCGSGCLALWWTDVFVCFFFKIPVGMKELPPTHKIAAIEHNMR